MNEKPMAEKAGDVMLNWMLNIGLIGFGIGVLLIVMGYDIIRAIY